MSFTKKKNKKIIQFMLLKAKVQAFQWLLICTQGIKIKMKYLLCLLNSTQNAILGWVNQG